MIRRTGETLKQYLPAKVQEVRQAGVPGSSLQNLCASRPH